jgi:hypothetical protein
MARHGRTLATTPCYGEEPNTMISGISATEALKIFKVSQELQMHFK